MTDTQQLIEEYQRQAEILAQDIAAKTGFKIEPNDPMIVALIAQRWFLEDFYKRQLATDNENAKGIYNALSPLVKKMQNTTELIDKKATELKSAAENLEDFRESIAAFFIKEAEKQGKEIVANHIALQVSDFAKQVADLKNTLSGSLTAFRLKSNLILGGVVLSQMFVLLILVFKFLL